MMKKYTIAVIVLLAVASPVAAGGIPIDHLDTPNVRIFVEQIEPGAIHQTVWIGVNPRGRATGVEIELPAEIDVEYLEINLDKDLLQEGYEIIGNGDSETPTRIVIAPVSATIQEILVHVEIWPVVEPTRMLVSAGGQTLETLLMDFRDSESPPEGSPYDYYIDVEHMMRLTAEVVENGETATLNLKAFPWGFNAAEPYMWEEADEGWVFVSLKGWELEEGSCGFYGEVTFNEGGYAVVFTKDYPNQMPDPPYEVPALDAPMWCVLELKASHFSRTASVEAGFAWEEVNIDNHLTLRSSSAAPYRIVMPLVAKGSYD